MDHLCYFCLVLWCFLARLFVDALWSLAGKGLTSWLSFVMTNCDVVTIALVSWVRCGAWLYRSLIFALFLTLHVTPKEVDGELPPLFDVNLHLLYSTTLYNNSTPTFSPVINIQHFYLLVSIILWINTIEHDIVFFKQVRAYINISGNLAAAKFIWCKYIYSVVSSKGRWKCWSVLPNLAAILDIEKSMRLNDKPRNVVKFETQLQKRTF